ncbi:major facilitator superfamily domain-containing protein [Cadophora sp. MPI-SDFR-AT-0126]|nr:major facilitator superfamily domain-containing protein [Leotiomycetes sp. MPI-SDFR-AT-0126]
MQPAENEKGVLEREVEQVEGTVRLFDSNGQIRKIPIPSNDPHDPLTWPTWKRAMVLITLCVYGTAGFGVIQSTPLFFSEIIPEYMRETRGRFNPSKISQLASYPSLCMGMGNFLFVPLSMMLGRRAIFLFNNVLMFASIVWAARSQDFSSHLAARCLQGLSCGIGDCLLPIMVLDMTFLHRRGLWMSIYWATTAAGSTALLVAVPFAVEHASSGWRTNYWFWSGFSAFSCIFSIFCLPETLYPRAPALIDGQLIITDQYGNVSVVAGDDFADLSNQQDTLENGPQPPISYLSQLAPVKYQQKGFRRCCMTFAQMAVSLLNPSVLWVLILNSLLFAGLVSQSLTYAIQLEHPPWNFSPAAVGTAQAGSFFGALIALGLSGATVDRISGIFTRRNGGLREPEHILPNFIIPGLLGFGGLVLYGCVAGSPEEHPGSGWIAIHISFGMYYCAFVALSAITGVWIGESTPHWSGAALVLVCGGRNALSFPISNNFDSWIDSRGFQNAYIELGAAFIGVLFVGGIPIFLWNKHLRRVWTKKMKFNLE